MKRKGTVLSFLGVAAFFALIASVVTVAMLLFGYVNEKYDGDRTVIAVVMLLVIVGNLIMMIATRTNSAIHDQLSHTVAVDMASQLIFDSPEALLEYKQKLHAEAAEKAEY